MVGYIREAFHAGSWYSSDSSELNEKLSRLLEAAAAEQPSSSMPTLRGIICPHAGYSYSGPTAAYSYRYLVEELNRADSKVEHILVLHPSHHVYLDGCAVSGASVLETPVGNLPVDDAMRDEILKLRSNKNSFSIMEQTDDEREHSGEMQYPFIARAIPASKAHIIKVLPIMCGSISGVQEEDYGNLLAPIVARPDVLCVVSTDFCHWGSRFHYQPTPETTRCIEIHEHIRDLDRRGMNYIELQEPGAFVKYLKQTRNTICGRHAVGVWLNAIHANDNAKREVLDIQFVSYAQSSQVRSMRDSSVSYASATARVKR